MFTISLDPTPSLIWNELQELLVTMMPIIVKSFVVDAASLIQHNVIESVVVLMCKKFFTEQK